MEPPSSRRLRAVDRHVCAGTSQQPPPSSPRSSSRLQTAALRAGVNAGGLPPLIGEIAAHTMQARNFWAAAPPKVSVLHYDWQDSILLQLSGTKKFTIVDPARLPASYPCVQLMTQLVRRAPGVFDARETERELDNFPLVNVTHPDLARHPLFRDALEHNGVFEVEVPEGAALLLPAYWHHQVESFAAFHFLGAQERYAALACDDTLRRYGIALRALGRRVLELRAEAALYSAFAV